MATFILGVLFGWLAEWIFYNFWVKPNESNCDCFTLQAELEAKKKQVVALQDQLSTTSSTSKSTVSSTSASKPAKAETAAAVSMAKTSSGANSKDNKLDEPQSTSSNAITSKTTSTTDQGRQEKQQEKQQEKAAITTSTTRTNTKKGDDFTKLSGIGPSMAATMKSLGIDTFKKLADTDDDILRDMLEESGARMNSNKEVMDSWNEQATLAANGDFDGLKKMQASLKK